jgi:hypothetical protein
MGGIKMKKYSKGLMTRRWPVFVFLMAVWPGVFISQPAQAQTSGAKFQTKTSGGAVGSDWMLWSDGYLESSVTFPATGNYQFQIQAYGASAANVAPAMEVRVDQKVVKTFSVNSTTAAPYSIQAPVTAGTHKIQVAFTNDYFVNGQDRNLYIRRMNIAKVTAPTPAALPDLVVTSLTLSPAAPVPGQAVTFTATVKNIGTVATPSGVVTGILFSVDGVPMTWSGNSGASLAPGASITLTANGGPSGSSTWTATSGAHTITGFVNDIARFAESNITNNKLNKPVSVATPTPTTPPSTGGALTTINQVIAEMSTNTASEVLPISPAYNWHYNSWINQYSPAGSSIAAFWKWERPTWCYGLLSWYTIYEGQGNRATNTRVEVRNLRIYILSNSTRKWTQFDRVLAPRTDRYHQDGIVGGTPAETRVEPDGGVSFRPAYPYLMHGYGKTNWPSVPLSNPSDVRALFVAMETRLVVADPTKPDDRALARYVINTAADYYPDATYKMWSQGYAPGAGSGRYILATPNYRSATFIVPNRDQGATLEEMRTNPPPLGAP